MSFDPKISFDTRLKAEFGVNSSGFYPKRDCDEQELKYIVSSETTLPFYKIREAIHSKPNRIVDSRAWSRQEYVLVTFNMDTAFQELAKAGFSLRVRIALESKEGKPHIKQGDMCIKTVLPSVPNLVMFKQTRGEWEVELPDLKPDLGKMIATHRKSERPLPAFFTEKGFKNDQFFVESIGCTMRNVYPSYEIVQYKGKIIVPTFQHTEDVLNLFMTPYADFVTSEDREAEAEFMGIKGISPGDIRPAEFEDIMRKGMELLDRTIVGADPSIGRNMLSKSARARMALENAYGAPNDLSGLTLGAQGQCLLGGSAFALSQRVHPQDVNLESIWQNIGHRYYETLRITPPDFNPFEYK